MNFFRRKTRSMCGTCRDTSTCHMDMDMHMDMNTIGHGCAVGGRRALCHCAAGQRTGTAPWHTIGQSPKCTDSSSTLRGDAYSAILQALHRVCAHSYIAYILTEAGPQRDAPAVPRTRYTRAIAAVLYVSVFQCSSLMGTHGVNGQQLSTMRKYCDRPVSSDLHANAAGPSQEQALCLFCVECVVPIRRSASRRLRQHMYLLALSTFAL